jgi:hypothetical protein
MSATSVIGRARIAATFVPMATVAVLFVLAVTGLLHGATEMQVVANLNIPYDLATQLVQLIADGLGELAALLFPPIAPYVDKVLMLIRTVGFDAAVQW